MAVGAAVGGAATEADPLLTLLASLRSFFHDTIVVSPGRSSTVNICRSPDLTKEGITLGEDSPPPAFSSTSMEQYGSVTSRVRRPRWFNSRDYGIDAHKSGRLGLQGSNSPNECRRLPEGERETMEKMTKRLARDGEWERTNACHCSGWEFRLFFSRISIW